MVAQREEKAADSVEFDEEKFEQLLLYVANKCEDDPNFGATVLNKILFYSDFLAFGMHGKSITGADYMALEHGPVPRKLVEIRKKMIGRSIAIQIRGQQQRVIALQEPDLQHFTPQEIVIVDRVIESVKGKSAERVSLGTHGFLGWQAAWAEGKVTGKHVSIPYATVFVGNPPLDEFEASRGRELATAYEWNI